MLLNPKARWDEQDDAAMDLGRHDEPEAEAALLQRAAELGQIPHDDPYAPVAESVGEALAEMWCRQGRFPVSAYERLEGIVRGGAETILRARCPQWLAP